MNPLVSILVPVYNTERFLEPCLKSLVEQTYHNYEVIIVDDVITSGKTAREVIHTVKDHGGEPICVTVLIDKADLSEIEEIPVESLIKVSRL